jgi:hypothetical protein
MGQTMTTVRIWEKSGTNYDFLKKMENKCIILGKKDYIFLKIREKTFLGL